LSQLSGLDISEALVSQRMFREMKECAELVRAKMAPLAPGPAREGEAEVVASGCMQEENMNLADVAIDSAGQHAALAGDGLSADEVAARTPDNAVAPLSPGMKGTKEGCARGSRDDDETSMALCAASPTSAGVSSAASSRPTDSPTTKRYRVRGSRLGGEGRRLLDQCIVKGLFEAPDESMMEPCSSAHVRAQGTSATINTIDVLVMDHIAEASTATQKGEKRYVGRSLKYLEALCRGDFIVHTRWLTDSLARGAPQEPRYYEVDRVSGHEYTRACK
jgi:hypothetical protein